MTWADDIRRTYGSWQRGWHFIDKPHIDEKADLSLIQLNAPHPLNLSNVMPDLYNWLSGNDDKLSESLAIKTIMSKVQSPLQGRSVALRLLMHYMGDMHQPLHTTERYSEEHPNGDYGGNIFVIKE